VVIRSTRGRQAALFSFLPVCLLLYGVTACQAAPTPERTTEAAATTFRSAAFAGNLRVVGSPVPLIPDQPRLDAMFLSLLRGQAPWGSAEHALPVTHELVVTVVNDDHHNDAIIVVLSWAGEWRDAGSDPASNARVQLELPYEHQRAGFMAEPERALGHDLEHFADAVSDNLVLRQSTDVEVTAALQTPDERTVELALREAARRQLAQAIPAVRALIAHPSDSVALSAIGTSAVLGDQLAARPAILRCEQVDDTFLVAAMPAIDRIGGIDAEAFLQALASGHPALEVRVRAQGLLAN